MKKVTQIILASSLALTLGACGSTSNQSSQYAKADANAEDDGMVCKIEKNETRNKENHKINRDNTRETKASSMT